MDLFQKAVVTEFEFEGKASKGRAGRIKGYGSTFGNIDQGGDRVIPGAFSEWLSQLKAEGRRIKMTDTHGAVIGDYDVAKEDDRGLYLEGEPLTGIKQAEEVMTLARAKVYDAMSIGYRIMKGGYHFDDEGVRNLTRLKVPEVAVLAFPMNEEAAITSAKGLNTKREMEKWLRDVANFSKREAQALMARGWEGLDELRDAGEPNQKGGREQFVSALDELLSKLKA